MVLFYLKINRMVMHLNVSVGLRMFFAMKTCEFMMYPWRGIGYVEYMRENSAPDDVAMRMVADHVEGWLIQEGYLKSPLPGSPRILSLN